MRNPTPAPIIVPVSGTPTCRGIALTVRDLSEWSRDADMGKDDDMVVLACAKRADTHNMLLCLRPTAEGKGACVGMTPTAFAVASLADDFAARALVVDPYDRDGNDIREAPVLHVHGGVVLSGDDLARIWDSLPGPTAEALASMDAADDAAVSVWEGSERV